MSQHSEKFWRELQDARTCEHSANMALLATQLQSKEVEKLSASLQELLPTVQAKISTAFDGQRYSAKEANQ
jgi:hypothetical protein